MLEAGDLLEARIIPMRHGGDIGVAFGTQACPDQPIAFHGRIEVQTQFRRDCAVPAGPGCVSQRPSLPKCRLVIGAPDAAAVMRAQAERHAAMGAQIVGHHDLTIHPVNHQRRIQQHGGGAACR